MAAAELPPAESELRAMLSSAAYSRADHIRRDKETITMANVRRLLESDLGLAKFALDPHKSILNPLVDEILLGADNGEAPEDEEKENNDDDNAYEDNEILKGASSSKAIKKASPRKPTEEESSEDLNSQEDLHIEAPKKKKQRRMKKEKEKVQSNEASGHDSGSHPEASEDESDVSEVKKPRKVHKTEIAKTSQDKKIDHLRKIIKACGLGVPPAIYKKAKQLDENRQNSFIIKELEGILNRKGLSSNATEKEIKAVKRKIAREKDLEGIDMTNIITEPRGRRAASQLFSPVYKPPKPPIREQESESESERESEGESDKDTKQEEGIESVEDDKDKPDNDKEVDDAKVADDEKVPDIDKVPDDGEKPDDVKNPPE